MYVYITIMIILILFFIYYLSQGTCGAHVHDDMADYTRIIYRIRRVFTSCLSSTLVFHSRCERASWDPPSHTTIYYERDGGRARRVRDKHGGAAYNITPMCDVPDGKSSGWVGVILYMYNMHI